MRKKVYSVIPEDAKTTRSRHKKPKHFRLIVEIGVVVAVILAVLAVRFIPWFLSQPVETPEDPYTDYQKLFNDVSNYDYANGASASLEKRIERVTSTDDTSSIQYYYNLKAKGEYYRRIGKFSVATKALEDALLQAPLLSEYEYLYTSLAECYRAMGDYAKASEYQKLLDGTE